MEEKKMDGWKVAKVVGNMTASICVGHLVGTAIKPLIQQASLPSKVAIYIGGMALSMYVGDRCGKAVVDYIGNWETLTKMIEAIMADEQEIEGPQTIGEEA